MADRAIEVDEDIVTITVTTTDGSKAEHRYAVADDAIADGWWDDLYTSIDLALKGVNPTLELHYPIAFYKSEHIVSVTLPRTLRGKNPPSLGFKGTKND